MGGFQACLDGIPADIPHDDVFDHGLAFPAASTGHGARQAGYFPV